MSDEKLEALVNNEIEWRRYLLKKMENIDSKLNSFMIKTIGYATALIGAIELLTKYSGKS